MDAVRTGLLGVLFDEALDAANVGSGPKQRNCSTGCCCAFPITNVTGAAVASFRPMCAAIWPRPA